MTSTRRRWAVAAACAGLMAGTLGCAPPCHDDGWLQMRCPAVADGTGDSSTGTPETSSSSGMVVVDSSGAATGSGGQTCPGVDGMFVSPTHTFHIVVEQGSAMLTDLDGMTRWDSVEVALLDPATGVVPPREAYTSFGLVLYRGLQVMCPLIVSEPPQLQAAAAMSALMSGESAAGFNPVSESLDVAVAEVLADTSVGPKTLVLVTGGEAATCVIPNPAGGQIDLTRTAAIDAVTAAYDAGVPTAVLGLGADLPDEYLQDLANAGSGHQIGDPDAPFHRATDDPSLVSALEELLSFEPICTFALDAPLPPSAATDCTVLVDGMAVDFEDPDGWSLPDMQQLQLNGTACDALEVPEISVQIDCACDD